MVAGATAGQLDVRAKLAALGIPVSLLVGALLLATGLNALPVAVTVGVLVVGAAAAATVFMLWSAAVVAREKAAGYSTLFDYPGYELRDPRTLELVRPADERPSNTVRRSLFRAMITVKPGTLVAKRLQQDDADDERDRTRPNA